MKNLFRRPLVMGIPFSGLLALSFAVLCAMVLGGSNKVANVVTTCIAFFGYTGLRMCTHFLNEGWETSLLYPLERKFRKKGNHAVLQVQNAELEIDSPDTFEREDLILEKEKIVAILGELKKNQSQIFEFSVEEAGCSAVILKASGKATQGSELVNVYPSLGDFKYCYSLKAVPVTTNPLTMLDLVSRLTPDYKILIRTTGLDFNRAKKMIENSRKRNARAGTSISNIDSDVSFDESSKVLESMSRGEETIAEFSLIILTKGLALNLDPSIFHLERNLELPIFSILGLRDGHFRSHHLRLVTISDLFPTFLDPRKDELSVLKTVRKNPLYFSPLDSRLEALHWLVVGASGTGKSFFTGAIISRLIKSGSAISAVFIDHNRSFKRIVDSKSSIYLEPQCLDDLKKNTGSFLPDLEQVGKICGVELSDLHFEEKKEAAFFLLSSIEKFLKGRKSTHVIYIVLDECWNFIRDEPVMVQRAFREFRKLNGAVIAITQSLSDFLSDISGRSIVQNASLRVLLRQGEDVSVYRGTLGLSDLEIKHLRLLRQKKGEFSECLIKTSFLSKIARLYPDDAEYVLLRTDNLREPIDKKLDSDELEVSRA